MDAEKTPKKRGPKGLGMPALKVARGDSTLDGELMPPYRYGGHKGSDIDDYDRQQVSIMAFMQFTQAQIATVLQISIPTLVENYKEELEYGFKHMGRQLVSHAFDIAMTNTKEGADMTKFLLRAKFGFTEQVEQKTENKPTFVDSLDYET